MTQVSVCIATYSGESDLLLSRCREALDRQSLPHELVVVSDDELSLSEARNEAVSQSNGDIIVFLDADAFAVGCDWLSTLVSPLDSGDVHVTASHILPSKDTAIPRELWWLIGATYRGYAPQHQRQTPVRNALGGAFAVTREAFNRVGGFNTGLGFDNGSKLQGEDADLCSRIRGVYGSDSVVYVPDAWVVHKTSPNDESLSGIVSRAYYQGVSKAMFNDDHELDTESSYLTETLPRAVGLRVYHVLLICLVTGSVGVGFIRGCLASESL